ncbi:DUF4158 domain-containing protein [Streptomyces sp. TE4109]
MQWGTVRMLGTFLTEDPTAVPASAVRFVAEQLGIVTSPSRSTGRGMARTPRYPRCARRSSESILSSGLTRQFRIDVCGAGLGCRVAGSRAPAETRKERTAHASHPCLSRICDLRRIRLPVGRRT